MTRRAGHRIGLDFRLISRTLYCTGMLSCSNIENGFMRAHMTPACEVGGYFLIDYGERQNQQQSLLLSMMISRGKLKTASHALHSNKNCLSSSSATCSTLCSTRHLFLVVEVKSFPHLWHIRSTSASSLYWAIGDWNLTRQGFFTIWRFCLFGMITRRCTKNHWQL